MPSVLLSESNEDVPGQSLSLAGTSKARELTESSGLLQPQFLSSMKWEGNSIVLGSAGLWRGGRGLQRAREQASQVFLLTV